MMTLPRELSLECHHYITTLHDLDQWEISFGHGSTALALHQSPASSCWPGERKLQPSSDNWSFPRYIWSELSLSARQDWLKCSISLSNLGQIKTLNRKIVALRQFLTTYQFPRIIIAINSNVGFINMFLIDSDNHNFSTWLQCILRCCYKDNLDQPYAL